MTEVPEGQEVPKFTIASTFDVNDAGLRYVGADGVPIERMVVAMLLSADVPLVLPPS
jgi:hypothetical protein